MADKVLSPRAAAHASVTAVMKSGRYSNLEIDSVLKSNEFSTDADRALYTRLVYGVIEKKITLDHIISQYSSRDVKDVDLPTLNALRLGVYQLVFMDKIPDFAAVSESVSTAPAKSKGFVNGVLRSLLRADKKYSLPEGDSAEDMSVRFSASVEVCGILIDSYGAETAEKILGALAPGRIDLRINTTKISVKEAEELLGTAAENPYLPDVLSVTTLTDAARRGIGEGLWFVQDTASGICTKVLGAMPHERVADTCAAPGGKTFSAAIDMGGAGEVFSFDLHENKLSLIKKTTERLGLSCVAVAERDAREPDPTLCGTCDRVLCDAPCSGIGVLAKKPEIRYKADEGAARLPGIQYDVLCGASEYVKPGGVLVYSTCTLNRRENDEVVSRFLSEHPCFRAVDFEVPAKNGKDLVSHGGMLTIFPHEAGCDGFFVAKMIRN